MGIETALAAIGSWLGASAASATAVGGLAAASVASTALSAAAAMKKPKMPSIPDPIAPPNQQASRAPERTAMMAANAGAARYGGNRSTFLTGASGIDSSTLNLGRNTLLGQ